MKTSFVLTGIGFFFSLSANASFWGGVDGGGGVGVRCNSSATSHTFEILDLHEAKLAGLQINHLPKSEGEAVSLAAELIAKHFWNPDTIPVADLKSSLARELIGPIFRGQGFWNPETSKAETVEFVSSLPLSTDVGKFNIQPGCTLEQIAYFSDTDEKLRIVSSAWIDLSWLDRSALVAHELIYMMDRREALENFGTPAGQITSERARKFIGQMFSAQGLHPKSDRMPTSGFIKCGGTGSTDADMTYFYAYRDGAKKFSSVFNVIHGLVSAYQTKATFSGFNISNLTDLKNGELDVEAVISFTGESNYPKAIIRLVKQKGAPPQISTWIYVHSKAIEVGTAQDLDCSN